MTTFIKVCREPSNTHPHQEDYDDAGENPILLQSLLQKLMFVESEQTGEKM